MKARDLADEIYGTQDLKDISEFNISLDSAVSMMETYAGKVKNLPIPIVSVSLPNGIDLGALANLLKYSDGYEISIQFWPDQIAVYISKDDVDLKDFGGDFEFAISSSIAYLDRITGNER